MYRNYVLRFYTKEICLGAWARFGGGAVPPGPNIEPPLCVTRASQGSKETFMHKLYILTITVRLTYQLIVSHKQIIKTFIKVLRD